VQIGRCNLHTAIQQGEQIIGDHALNRVFVAELQADPQSVQFGPGEKCFALGLKIIGEFADKINTANFFHREISLFAFRSKQLECFRFAEFAGVQVTAQDPAIEESHDDFLVCRGWSSYSHGGRPESRVLRVRPNYVMLSDLLLSSVYFSKG
jgi:hypothetical protein